jgi:DNA-binding transcriptional regulator YhcF (GntR family)
MDGWITLHRKMLEWEWYDDIPTCRLFVHLLLRANFKKCQWHGQTINEGELITSIGSLSEETGLTIKQVRRALDNLKTTGEIGTRRADKGQCITIRNYGIYQAYEKLKGQEKGKKRARKGQEKGNSITNITKKQSNNDNTNVAERTPALKKCPSVLLTEEQWDSLLDMLGQKDFDNYCENLQTYINEGHKVHNCYKTILAWARKDREL